MIKLIFNYCRLNYICVSSRKKEWKSIFIIDHSSNQRNVMAEKWDSQVGNLWGFAIISRRSLCAGGKSSRWSLPFKRNKKYSLGTLVTPLRLDTVLCQSSDLLFTDRDRLLKEVEKWRISASCLFRNVFEN